MRARYAVTIREGRAGSHDRDFELIGTGYHKWAREPRALAEGGPKTVPVPLRSSGEYAEFIKVDFDRFAGHYGRLRRHAETYDPAWEALYCNAQNQFTLQYPLALAPLEASDDTDTANRKMRLVSIYADIFLVRRVVNFKSVTYSSQKYTMFNLMKEMRGLDPAGLAVLLKTRLSEMDEDFSGIDGFYLNAFSRRFIFHILARLTAHIERESGVASMLPQYLFGAVSPEGKRTPFEIEHIWANHFDRHTHEFASETDFAYHRNRIGDLLLVPRGFNQSYGDMIYSGDTDEKKNKVTHYNGQNLLARWLHPLAYSNNPLFTHYTARTGLPFQAHPDFNKADLEARTALYRALCDEIWNPSRLDAALL